MREKEIGFYVWILCGLYGEAAEKWGCIWEMEKAWNAAL